MEAVRILPEEAAASPPLAAMVGLSPAAQVMEAAVAAEQPVAPAGMEAPAPPWGVPVEAEWRGPVASLAPAASVHFAGRFRTASSRRRAAAKAPIFLRAGSSPAAAHRRGCGSVAKSAQRTLFAGLDTGMRSPKARPSAGGASTARSAVPSAASSGAYRCRSRNTPCSPNKFASREARRHGARRPPSSAASHRSTT
jgi:hypothetical protein